MDVELAVEERGVPADVLDGDVGEVGLRLLDVGDLVRHELLRLAQQLRHDRSNKRRSHDDEKDKLRAAVSLQYSSFVYFPLLFCTVCVDKD